MERSSKTANAELPNREVEPTQKEGGEYKIIMKMASGSFGTVFKVQRNSDNRVFVMKRIPLVLDDKHNRSVRLRQTLNERHKNESDVLCNHDNDEDEETKGNGKLHKKNANLNNLNVNNKSEKNHRGFENRNTPNAVNENDSFYDNNINSNEDLYEQDDEEELRKREVLHEATLMKELHHPFIVRQMDCFTFNETDLCLILDYYGGGDLHSMINQAKENKTFFPLNTVMLWFVQILLALHYLHVKGIVHRDMKTHNVFLNDTKQFVAIGDFGIAESVEEIVHETALAQQASCTTATTTTSDNNKNENINRKNGSSNKPSRSSSAKRVGDSDLKRQNSSTSQKMNGNDRNASNTSKDASSPVFNKNKLNIGTNNTNGLVGGKHDTTVMHALRRNLQREREKNIGSNVPFTSKSDNNNSNIVEKKNGKDNHNDVIQERGVVGNRRNMHVNGMKSRSSVVINTNNPNNTNNNNNNNNSFNSNNNNSNTKRSSSSTKRDKTTDIGQGRASSPKLPSLSKDKKRIGSSFNAEHNSIINSKNIDDSSNGNNYNSTERRRKKSLMGSTTYALKGTPLYMAPELLQGGLGNNNSNSGNKIKSIEGTDNNSNNTLPSPVQDNQVLIEITKSGDMWSLGCVLYELLTLHHPFESRELGALVLKIVQGNYKPLHECMSEYYKQHGGAKPVRYPDWVHNLVSSLLTIDPLKRPSCEELLTRWPPIVHYFHLLLKEIGDEESASNRATNNIGGKRQGNMSYKNGKNKEASLTSSSSSSSCTSPFWLFVESSSKKTFKYQVSHLTELQKRNELERRESENYEANSSTHQKNNKKSNNSNVQSNSRSVNEPAESQKNVNEDDYNYFAKPLPSSNLVNVNIDIDNNVNLYSFFDSKHDQTDFIDDTIDNSDNTEENENMDGINKKENSDMNDANSSKANSSSSTNKGKKQVNTRVRKKNYSVDANNESSKNAKKSTSSNSSPSFAKRGSKRENSLEVCEEIDNTMISWKDASNSYGSSPGTFFDENQAAEFIYKERSFSLPSCDNDDDEAEQENEEGKMPSTKDKKENKKQHVSRSNSLVHLDSTAERGMKPSASMKPYMIYDEPHDKDNNNDNDVNNKVQSKRRSSQVNNTPNSKILQQNKSNATLTIKSVLTQENVRNLIKQGNNNISHRNSTNTDIEKNTSSRSSGNIFAKHNINTNNNVKKRSNSEQRRSIVESNENTNTNKKAMNDNVKGNKAMKLTENERNVPNSVFFHEKNYNNKGHAATSFALPHESSVHLDMTNDVRDMTTPQLAQEVTHMRALIQHILREQQRVFAMEAISPSKNNKQNKFSKSSNNKNKKSPYCDRNSISESKQEDENRSKTKSRGSNSSLISKTTNNRRNSIKSDASQNATSSGNNDDKVKNERNSNAIKQEDIKRHGSITGGSSNASVTSQPSKETCTNKLSVAKINTNNRNANQSNKRNETKSNPVQLEVTKSKTESEANKDNSANRKQTERLPDVKNINNNNNIVKKKVENDRNVKDVCKAADHVNQAIAEKEIMRSLELEPEWYYEEEEEEEELEESDKEKQPKLRPISQNMQARRQILVNIIHKYFNESTVHAVYDYYKSTRASKLMERDPIKVLN